MCSCFLEDYQRKNSLLTAIRLHYCILSDVALQTIDRKKLFKGGGERVAGATMENNRKSIGNILSEALDIITGNPMIIVPYLIPVILTLIGAFAAIGMFVPEGVMQPDFELDPGFFLDNALAFVGFASIFGVLSWIFGVVADAFAIDITFNATQEKKVTLSEAWGQIGFGKILVLLIVSFITLILTILGFFALCIGALIVMILLIFVMQGIVIDDLDIGATFSNSYNIAKDNFFDILILLLIFVVLGIIVGMIPYIGGILAIFVGIYATVAYTVLYLDRK